MPPQGARWTPPARRGHVPRRPRRPAARSDTSRATLDVRGAHSPAVPSGQPARHPSGAGRAARAAAARRAPARCSRRSRAGSPPTARRSGDRWRRPGWPGRAGAPAGLDVWPRRAQVARRRRAPRVVRERRTPTPHFDLTLAARSVRGAQRSARLVREILRRRSKPRTLPPRRATEASPSGRAEGPRPQGRA